MNLNILLAKTLGFVRFDASNQGRNYGPALDRAGNITHWILPTDGSLEPGNYNVPAGIKRYKETHQNFEVEDKVYDIDCLHLRDNDTYIDAHGRIAPCCYQGFDLPGVPFIKLEDLSKLKETWPTKKCNSVCAMSCGN